MRNLGLIRGLTECLSVQLPLFLRAQQRMTISKTSLLNRCIATRHTPIALMCPYPGDEAGAVDSPEASLQCIILHVIDFSLQPLQLLLFHAQLLQQSLHSGPLMQQQS